MGFPRLTLKLLLLMLMVLMLNVVREGLLDSLERQASLRGLGEGPLWVLSLLRGVEIGVLGDPWGRSGPPWLHALHAGLAWEGAVGLPGVHSCLLGQHGCLGGLLHCRDDGRGCGVLDLWWGVCRGHAHLH